MTRKQAARKLRRFFSDSDPLHEIRAMRSGGMCILMMLERSGDYRFPGRENPAWKRNVVA